MTPDAADVQRPTPPLTEEELAEISARDQALGPKPAATTLSVSRQIDDAPEFGTSRFVPTARPASLEVTAGEVVVLRIEDGKLTCTEPHLSSWGEATADRRRLIAEVDRLRYFMAQRFVTFDGEVVRLLDYYDRAGMHDIADPEPPVYRRPYP